MLLLYLLWANVAFAELQLPIIIEVDQSSVYLHQVLGDKNLPNIKVIDGLNLGETFKIEGQEFKSLLKTKLGIDVKMVGKGSVVIHRRYQVISQDLINSIVTEYLQDKYSNDIGRIDAKIQIRDRILAPLGDVSIRVKESETRDLKEKMFVWIEIQLSTGTSLVRKLMISVENFQAFPFFRSNMKKGDVIDEQDILYRVVNIFSVAKEIPDLALSKWRLKTTVSRHDPLTINIIEDVPDISKGEKLKVRMQLNGIGIEYLADAMTDAKVNELVLIKFNGRKRRVRLKKDLDGSFYGI